MTSRDYQYHFSDHVSGMHDVQGREQKARTMVAVLEDYFGPPLGRLRLLDVGASTGIIDNFLAQHFGDVTGIDIDVSAINHAKTSFSGDNLSFSVGDALSIDSVDEVFDVVICSQVYEHVPDAVKMIDEIFRVLKPGGVCYFAANNRIMWNEPHYNLPLLSILPRPLAHIYARMSGRATHYHELHFTYWGLRSLVRRFEVIDYTRKIVDQPQKYRMEAMLPPGSFKQRLASIVAAYCYWVMPGYIWLLKKPGAPFIRSGSQRSAEEPKLLQDGEKR